MEWGPSARGQQAWTEVHDGNVEAVTKRVKTRVGRDDVVAIHYEVQMLN